MKLPIFQIPVSAKAITTALIAFIVGTIEPSIGIHVSDSLNALIASGVGLAIGFAVPEGAKYIDYWLSKNDLPVHVDPKA